MFFFHRGKVPHGVRPTEATPSAQPPKPASQPTETPTTLKDLEVIEDKARFIKAFDDGHFHGSFWCISNPLPGGGYELTVGKHGEERKLAVVTIRNSNFPNRLTWKFDDGTPEGHEQGELDNMWSPAMWHSRLGEVVDLFSEFLERAKVQ